MTDIISLRGITATGFHGVFADEKAQGQPFVVDIDLEADLAPAAHSDDLADTIDYAELTRDVVAEIRGDSLDLVETLAARIADVCLARELAQAVTVTVHKPDAPMPASVADVAVTIRRAK